MLKGAIIIFFGVYYSIGAAMVVIFRSEIAQEVTELVSNYVYEKPKCLDTKKIEMVRFDKPTIFEDWVDIKDDFPTLQSEEIR